MAELPTPNDAPAHASGLELRLERGGAYVALPAGALAPGLELVALALEVPGVRLPFDVSAGAAQFHGRLCELDRAEVAARPEALSAAVAPLAEPGSGLARLDLAPRAGFLEAAGALADGTPFTLKAALLAEEGGARLLLRLHAPRLYAPSRVPAARLPALVARALRGLADGEPEGGALRLDPLPALLRRTLPGRGFKLPRAAAARLARAEVEAGGVRLVWDRAAAAPAPADPDLLLELEGARVFADAERLLAAGDLGGALAAYRALDRAQAAHPFASARLVSLLALDPSHGAEALAAATAAVARRPDDAGALAALAQVRAGRGEPAAASQALAAAAAAAARHGEESSALAAAEACLALGPAAEPAALARAAELALGLRKDHLAALRALVALGERGEDREALLRACRRLAAYAPDTEEKAAAHARLGRLLAADLPAARLHLDHAARLARAPETLRALARTCDEAGEHLRAVRALDRLRDEALARGETALAAEAEEEAAVSWEKAGQPENAALRREEAARLRRAALPPLPALSPEGGEGDSQVVIPPGAPGAPATPATPAAPAHGVSSPSPREAGGGASPTPPAPAAAPLPPALSEALAAARAAPLDPAALAPLARHAASAAPWRAPAERRRLELLARTAAALGAFAEGIPLADEDASPREPPPALRAAVAHPSSRGALPRLLALLAPALEPLYQSGLAHRGVGPADALGPAHAPELLALLAAARRALGARACAAYLRGEGGLEVQLENTQPPSLVLGRELARAPAPAARFLLARGLALVDLGWALAGRLGPEARGLLCELACRFAGGALAAPAIPAARAEALLAALTRTVPAAIRSEAAALGAAASAELAVTPQPQLAAAARRTASRLALLHAGAPGAALAALVESERPLRERPRPEALAHGDVRDLAAFALTDVWLDFRAEGP
ncbi:hypothetical protein [Anaeromyxobacter diazotrophicus]|uniref:Uncharacterized protein n=1 Tax=Anaeromyxobacter diazotrophicus TaxID=2590199 RepID=A0A7I9VKN0_9BACT|nr:hypothetical protein [Anaeromyxobacter diazotrophicus]GEJ56738.1 hypothetical protein AMYX_14790 [Anaeromyxobacter diazotrophicus]